MSTRVVGRGRVGVGGARTELVEQPRVCLADRREEDVLLERRRLGPQLHHRPRGLERERLVHTASVRKQGVGRKSGGGGGERGARSARLVTVGVVSADDGNEPEDGGWVWGRTLA